MESVAIGIEGLRLNPLRPLLSTLGVVIGVAFRTYPANLAARLSPIDAIRHE